MKRRTLVTIAALAACHTVAQPGSQSIPEARKDPIVRAPERADAGPRETNAADAGPAPPEAPPRWGKLPESHGELFSVIDGSCRGLALHPIDNGLLVSYATSNNVAIAKLTDDGLEKLPSAKVAEGQPWIDHVHRIVGRYPDALWLEYDDGGRCTYREAAVRLAGKAWKPAFDLGALDSVRDVQPYKDGAIGWHGCTDACGGNDQGDKCASGTMWSDGLARTPPLTSGPFRMDAFTSLPSGEVYAVGAACAATATTPCTTSQLRWWSPGGKVATASYPRTGSYGRILARSATDVVVTDGRVIHVFDGAKLRKLATAPFDVYTIIDRGPGGFWVASTESLAAVAPDGNVTDITPPKVGKGNLLSVSAKGETAWAAHGDGVYRREGGAWRQVELPRPAFSSTTAYLTPGYVHVRAPDEVWLTASYNEQQPGWSDVDRRTTILSTKRPKQTLRCRLEPLGYDTMLGGFLAWPAPVTDACKTPFVVLALVSPSSPKTNDYPKTRALLKPYVGSITDDALVEIRQDDVTWVGVRASSPEVARKIAATYAKSYPMARTEAVCADPEVARTIPIDPKGK